MVIAHILGIFLFLYLVWKRLKEDYNPEKIFNLCFLTIFSFLVGFFVSTSVASEYWFWIETLFITLGFLIILKRQKLKVFETFEALVISFLPWLSLYFLASAIKSSSLSSFLAFWVSLICIFIFFFLNSFYRSFTWYKSGRVGFSGLVTLIVFFIARAGLMFSNKFELILSGSTALLLMIVLYNLSRNKE